MRIKNFAQLQKAVRKLNALMQAPQHGLATWNEAYGQLMNEIVDYWLVGQGTDEAPKPMRYSISIDRQARMWAVFDDRFECVKPFVGYTDEAKALAEARAWLTAAGYVGEEPEVVYSRITRMVMRS